MDGPDARNVPALGRIGDPDDIIGTVLVEEGKVRHGVVHGLSYLSSCAPFSIDHPVNLPENAFLQVRRSKLKLPG